MTVDANGNNFVAKSHGDDVLLGAGPGGSVVGYVDNDNDFSFTSGDREVFRITDNGGGTFTFDLRDHLDHNRPGATGTGDAKTLTLDLTNAFGAKDFDGDIAPLGNHAIRVVVENDVPVASTSTVNLDEDGLSGGNQGGPGDYNINSNGPTTVNANLNVNFGADGAGTTSFLNTILLPSVGDFSVGTATSTGVIIQQHGVNVLQITLTDASTGAYTVTQLRNIDHPTSGTEDNLQFTISYSATDYDGDTATGSFTIDIDDDTPTVGSISGTPVIESTANTLFSNAFIPASTSGSLAISWGADNVETGSNQRSVAFDTSLNGPSGLTSNGDAITYTLSATTRY